MISKSLPFALTLAISFAGAAHAAAVIGQTAPTLTLTDVNGKTVKLSDFKGKHVVLEWHNPGCPFVQKHYDSGNMQRLQNQYDARDTIWLTINSTNPNHQDYLGADKLKAYIADKKAAPDYYIPDPEGQAGLAYGAKTTPHMYIIDPAGTLIYAGAIDDKRSTRVEDVKTAKNYVVAALEESKAGKPVSTPSTTPYGCSVKFK